MRLDEAITHFEDVAKQLKEMGKEEKEISDSKILQRADEYRQVASWLRELKDIKERLDDDWK